MNGRRHGFPAGYVLPALLLAALVWLAPLLYSFSISLTDGTPGSPGKWVGAANYLRALSSPSFAHSVAVSLIYASGTMVLSVLFGFAVAVLLRTNAKARAVTQTVLLLPWVLSELAVALIWGSFLNEDHGLINTTLARLALPSIPFFSSAGGAMAALWLAALWRGLALSVMLQMTGLASLPQNLIHAARIDGASRLLILADLLWPHQRRFLAINALMVFLMAVVAFSLPFALTAGGPLFATETVALLAYRTGFSGRFELGFAAAQGMIVLFAYGALAWLLLRLRRRPA